MSFAEMLLVSLVMAQDAGQAKIEEWIRHLGNEEIETREQAQSELLKIGAPAAALLRKAVHDSDLERASRARTILARIEGKKNGSGEPARASRAARGDEESPSSEEWLWIPTNGRVLRVRVRHFRMFGSWFWPLWEIGNEVG
jgi:hypothetical protein